MGHRMAADFVAHLHERIDIAPIEEFDGRYVELSLAKLACHLEALFSDHRGNDEKASADSKLFHDLARANTVLEPVIETERDIRSVDIAPLNPPHSI